jgi:hypothetical protein
MSETDRERTWRERREAQDAMAEALDRYSVLEVKLNDARLAYHAAIKRHDEAVKRNIEAWHEPDAGGGGVSG